jgi:hypothetical protein
LPDYVKKISFDGIILGPTFLGARFRSQTYTRIRKEYGFIKKSGAYKIALPQDDYDCSAILDRWMVEWEVNKVYTVCPDHWGVLYPKYLKQGGNLELGYTGYISNELIKRAANPLELSKRNLDVCYRASNLRPNFGRLGAIKSDIAHLFLEATKSFELKYDISVDTNDIIPGEKWLDFIESSKCILGTNSGSSLLDPEGEIRKCVSDILDKNPNAPFTDVEEQCFPGLDGNYIFTAISPRVFEAGLLKTAQILIPGLYSRDLEPWEHFIPLNEDLSNVDEVVTAIKDLETLERITESCKERLLSLPELRMETHVNNLLNDLRSNEMKHYNQKIGDKENALILKYSRNTILKSFFVWMIDDIKKFITYRFPFTRTIYRKVCRMMM